MSALAFTLYLGLLTVSFALCAVIALPVNLAPVITMLFGGTP